MTIKGVHPLNIGGSTQRNPAIIKPDNIFWTTSGRPYVLLGEEQYDMDHYNNRAQNRASFVDEHLTMNLSGLGTNVFGGIIVHYQPVTKAKSRKKYFAVELSDNLVHTEGFTTLDPEFIPLNHVSATVDQTDETIRWAQRVITALVSNRMSSKNAEEIQESNKAAMHLLFELMGKDPSLYYDRGNDSLPSLFWKNVEQKTRDLAFRLLLAYWAKQTDVNRNKVKQVLEYEQIRQKSSGKSLTNAMDYTNAWLGIPTTGVTP